MSTTKTARKAPAKKSAEKIRVVAIKTRSHLELWFDGGKEPFSRIANGAPGSDAAAQVENRLTALREVFDITVRDEQR